MAGFRQVLLVLCLGFSLSPAPAAAYNFTSQPLFSGNIVCPNPNPLQDPRAGLTRRIVPCIRDNIIVAVHNFVGPFSSYLSGIIAILCTLAIAFLGFKMITGDTHAITRDVGILAVKLALVGSVVFSMDWIFGLLLYVMDDILTSVANYAINFSSFLSIFGCTANDPSTLIIWDTVDCAIEALVGGIFSPFTLVLGIVGFLFACLFSGGIGFFIAMLGFYLITQLLFAIARALYIYISSYIAFAIMIMISPLFIPLVLFQATAGYFEKWLRLTLTFMLQPIILFAYLSLLIAAFDATVFTGPAALYRSIAGSNVDSPGFSIGPWLSAVGAYGATSTGGQAINIDPKQVSKALGPLAPTDTGVAGNIGEIITGDLNDWQFGVYEAMGLGDAYDPVTGELNLRFFKLDLPGVGIDWANPVINLIGSATSTDILSYTINILLSLVMAVATAYIFTTMLNYLPFISSAIAGAPLEFPKFGIDKMATPGSSMMEKFSNSMFSSVSGGKGAKP